MGVNGYDRYLEKTLKTEKPIRADGMAMVLIHPVCSPKYVLEKVMRAPIRRPTSRDRVVKLCGEVAEERELSVKAVRSPKSTEDVSGEPSRTAPSS